MTIVSVHPKCISHKALLLGAARRWWLGKWHVVILRSVYTARAVVFQSHRLKWYSVRMKKKKMCFAKLKDSADLV